MIAIELCETAQQSQLRTLLESIVSSIAKKTPHPTIEHYPNKALFTLAVNPHDQGRFIGKLGATIWAIQTIFWYAGYCQFGYSYSVKLLEPEKPARDRKPVPVKFNPNWDRKKIEKLIGGIVSTCLKSYGSFLMSDVNETTVKVYLRIEKYLQTPLCEPNFIEAFQTVVRAAGISNGVHIETESVFA